MNNEEAKFILSTLRPGRLSSADHDVAEALARVNSDPDLAAWFAERRAFDQAVSDKLGELAPPPGLHSAILAGIRVSRPRPWWRRRVALLGAAAAVILALVPVLYHHRSDSEARSAASANQNSVETFRHDMIEAIAGLEDFHFASGDGEEVLDWLKGHGANTEFPMPEGLGKLSTAGCRVIEWRGRRASLICFRANADESMPTVHLVVLEDGLDAPPQGAASPVESEGEWSSTVWREGGLTLMLAAKGDAEAVRRLAPLG